MGFLRPRAWVVAVLPVVVACSGRNGTEGAAVRDASADGLAKSRNDAGTSGSRDAAPSRPAPNLVIDAGRGHDAIAVTTIVDAGTGGAPGNGGSTPVEDAAPSADASVVVDASIAPDSSAVAEAGAPATRDARHGAGPDGGVGMIADAGFDCSRGYHGVDTPGATHPLSTCGAITESGTYVLDQDITASGECLYVQAIPHVRLDCAGHTVTGAPPLKTFLTDDFEVENCVFVPSDLAQAVDLLGGTRVGFHDDVFVGGVVSIDGLTDLHFFDNTVSGVYQQRDSYQSFASCNHMTSAIVAPDLTSFVLQVSGGSQNHVERNDVDGKWDGNFNPIHDYGADDGIFVENETDDVIADNSVVNNWDCGIETLGDVARTVFSGNHIVTSGLAGIGGFYGNNVSGCTFADNVIDTARQAFTFWRIYGVNDNAPQVLFTNNRFDGNTFTNQVNPSQPSLSIPVFSELNYDGKTSGNPSERVPAPGDFVLTNNRFRDNHFGPGAPPDFGQGPVVAGFIVDEGGNGCTRGAAEDYPLECK
ncbi:MAG TPA: hypothetical protein VHC69_10060 [Polyangiaceae bacterium]|nr:hypothetical protein [Polyangiaceae bacterium]